jgi:hypothetical protein
MDGSQTAWQGRTFVARVDPVAIYPLNGGYAARVWIAGDFTLASLFIGPVSARNPFIASAMYQLTFNGGSKSVVVTLDTLNDYVPVVSDDLPIGIDGSRGLIVSGYIDPSGNGVVLTQSVQFGWSSKYALGDSAFDLDKTTSNYVDTTTLYNSVAVQMIEGYYTPPSTGIGILP